MVKGLTSHLPGIDKLVERQMRNWELARSQRQGRQTTIPTGVADFICLSRQVGTDGHGVATGLAERLGWPVFGREILDAMAESDETRRRIYESMDERDLGWWEETLRSLMESDFVRNDYFKRLCETLLSLARQGPGIFLGRGADLVLPRDSGFRVRLMAPFEDRLQRVCSIMEIDESEAKRQIQRIESERRAFFQRHFGVDSDDPLRFDTTINLARFSNDQAVEAILQSRRIRAHS